MVRMVFTSLSESEISRPIFGNLIIYSKYRKEISDTKRFAGWEGSKVDTKAVMMKIVISSQLPGLIAK